MSKKNSNGIYHSKCGEFILTPLTGSRLRVNSVKQNVTGTRQFSYFINEVMHTSEFKLIAHFTELLHNKSLSAAFVKEYNRDFVKYNPAARLYRDKLPIGYFMCASIKKQLIQVYNAKRPAG